jgi:hypothetical protein
MIKKDHGNSDTASRTNEDASGPEQQNHPAVEISSEKTEVKNAHASGDGSLEKPDEDLSTDQPSPGSSPF